MGRFHTHIPKCTGRRIRASFGKENLPDGIRPIVSTGELAICEKCRMRLIMHDPRWNLPTKWTELERVA